MASATPNDRNASQTRLRFVKCFIFVTRVRSILDALAPLTFEMGGILLVDLPLLLRRRIGPGDIETSILHEVEIGVAAARLAAAREFRVTLLERGGARFPHHKLFGEIGAFLEIGRPARPPLRPRLAWQQHGAAEHQQAELHRGYDRT